MSFNPDLTLNAIVVNLIATHDGYVPLTQGALAHAAFFDLVAAADPDLAARLHDSGARQPFTISPLRELPAHAGATTEDRPYALRAGNRVALRLTLLDPDLFRAFLQRLLAAGPDLRLRIGDVVFAVESAIGAPGSHRWAGYTTAGELRKIASTDQRIRMLFASPTAVNWSKEGTADRRMILIPWPQAVFAVAAWNLESAHRRRDLHRVREMGRRFRRGSRSTQLADRGLPTQARHLSRRLRRCDLRSAGQSPRPRAHAQLAG